MYLCYYVCECVCPCPVRSVYKSAEDDVSGSHSSMITCCWPPCVLSPRAAHQSTVHFSPTLSLDTVTHLFAGVL